MYFCRLISVLIYYNNYIRKYYLNKWNSLKRTTFFYKSWILGNNTVNMSSKTLVKSDTDWWTTKDWNANLTSIFKHLFLTALKLKSPETSWVWFINEKHGTTNWHIHPCLKLTLWFSVLFDYQWTTSLLHDILTCFQVTTSYINTKIKITPLDINIEPGYKVYGTQLFLKI